MKPIAGGAADTSWALINRASWDERVAIHRQSAFYDVDGFLAGKSTLSGAERSALGPVTGRSLVHLQCHFGLDTLSWAREGAEVTGLDFSEPAILEAKKLSRTARLNAEFYCTDVYSAVEILNRKFDIVYTGLGALCWLPDIERWAKVIAGLLAPGGELYLTEFHPFEWVFGETELVAKYDYFTEKGGLKIDLPGSYADPDAVTKNDATVQWNHGLGAVVTALANAGLKITSLEEHQRSQIQRWPFMIKSTEGFYKMPPGKTNLPLHYTLRATR